MKASDPGRLHRTFLDMALPYVTNSSPTSADPQYVGGSNAVTSIVGKVERRAGFSASIESTKSIFPAGETISELFQWRKWGGSFVTMVCTTTQTSAKVYAYRSGLDTSFSLIYTATATDGNAFSFCAANNTCFMGNGNANDMRAYDATSLVTRKWGITAPSSAPAVSTTTGGATINVYRSLKYVQTWCNSSTGNESSPSPISACIGPMTNGVALVAVSPSTDTQVDQIRVYRTTDGGSADPPDMRELPNSPFPNASSTIQDRSNDTGLGIRTAPEFNRNDPPPGMTGLRYLENSSRIAGFSGNTVYYSGFEEIENGVPYECFPSGLDGNNYPFGSEVTAIAELPDGYAVFCADSINEIQGDTLDTFRRVVLARRQGTRNYKNVATLGSLCVWLDTSGTVWMMGGNEIGQYIRPSLATIDQTHSQVTIHIMGNRRWVLVLDGVTGNIYPFDLDKNQWMTPWTTSATALHSGETSVGTFSLIAGLSLTRTVMRQVEGTFNDDGELYAGGVQTGMLDISPESKPDWRGVVDYVDVKRNTVSLSAVSQLNDDDPQQGTYVDITANRVDQPLVPQGSSIKADRFGAMPTTNVCRQTSIKLEWPAADAKSELYYLDIGFHPLGG